MRRAFVVIAAAALLASEARAQGSGFALRGLGWVGRPVSGRSAGAAGSLSMFDPQMVANPAALTRWRATTGFAVGVPTRRTFTGPAGDAELTTARFPLIGFAAPLPPRLIIGVAFADYLDRSFTITREDSVLLRGQYESYTDAGRSLGGVTNLALTVGHRTSPNLSLGAAFHYYMGSTRLAAQRLWENTDFADVGLASTTDFRGFGLGLGFIATMRRLEIAGSGRLNGKLLSENTGETEARTPLPLELNGGLRAEVVPGIFLNGAVQYLSWSRADQALKDAGEDGARNTLGISVGAEVQSVTLAAVRTPLRLGYRWRQLPFSNLNDELNETAFSVGVGFNFARDRSTFDLAVERGNREAGTSKETFTSLFVGLTVRP